jgi:hypothetical protein
MMGNEDGFIDRSFQYIGTTTLQTADAKVFGTVSRASGWAAITGGLGGLGGAGGSVVQQW